MTIDQQIDGVVRRTVRETLESVLTEHFNPPTVQREALSVAETAEALGRSESWVRDAIHHHGMPARSVGPNGQLLVPLHKLRRWLESSEAADLDTAQSA